jgi:23S rRNA pseudouridine1911/1915/1917 synthase
MTSRTLTADRGDAARRLDVMVCRHLRDVDGATRTRVQVWIQNGGVRVNGAIVRRPATRTAAGDVVIVELPEARSRPLMLAEHVALRVLYEDEHMIVIDKPPGVVVHPTYKNMTGTVMNALLWRARAWPAGRHPSIVGRLDKLTSGLVVSAKTPSMHAALQRELGSARSEKHYLAVVYGRVNQPRGEIDLAICRDPSDRRRMVVSASLGAPSVTRFERLARAAVPRAGASLLRCCLVTGRTHQIRVHLAARGWPLIGDPVYSEPRWSVVEDRAVADLLRVFPRQALHAWRLTISHPVTRRRLSIEAPVPDDLDRLMTAVTLNGHLGPRGHGSN